MDKESARKLVQETLQGSFSKDRFVYLIKNILNHLDEASFTYKGNFIFDDFADSIRTVERIGKYTDPEGKLLDILIVHLQKETSLERARTKQRNFVAKYLKGSRGGVLKDAALAAFVAPNGEDWRFSLVKMEYKFNEKGKVEEEFTPARRYSFLVGKNENSHTAQSRLLPRLLEDEVNPTLDDLEYVFSVERVTKEFFEKYRDLFLRLKESLDTLVKKDAPIKADFKEKSVDTVDFAKKLLGQIVFLYFLQKKGWFGVERKKEWGTGSKRFLRELFEKKHGEYKNFFNDILEPLFYEALRLERPGDYYSRFDCRIPFLNGGLFDPINDYDWVETEILLDDDIFSNDRKTKEGDTGDGILDVFDRYNFTVKEDEPLEKEVAVDPEMLGRAYEKFNAIRSDNFEEYRKALISGKKGEESKFNKQYGVYYTPPEIVHYMCQESLANYLMAETEGKVSKEDIETLIKYGESVIEHDSRVVNEGRETKTYAFKLPQNVRQYAKLIDDKLDVIRVCDPAVGSGAFPVGMMSEIIRTRNALTPHVDENGKRTTYHFKRKAIQNCLYGVDIDPGAVEIAKLRLWLSLIVDEEEREKIQPLPNLDYKIMQGNSLIELISYTSTTDEKRNKIIRQLKYLKDDLFTATSPMAKTEIRGEIEKFIKQLFEFDKLKEIKELKQKITNVQSQKRLFEDEIDKKEDKSKVQELEFKMEELKNISIPGASDHFEWHINFSEVFQEKDGFDVIIANPPYGADFNEVQNNYLKQRFNYIAERIRNSFLYFIGLSYEITKKEGVVCLILPNEFLFQIYMTKARKFFLDHAQFLFALNVGEDVFEAIVPTCIVAFEKNQEKTFNIAVADLRDCNLTELPKKLNTSSFLKISSDIIKATPNAIFTFDSKKSLLINRLTEKFFPFETFCDDIANGISTSCDTVYIVSDEVIQNEHLESIYLKPCIRGGQFHRYFCPQTTHDNLLYITSEFEAKKAKNIYNYLKRHKKLLIEKSVEKKKGSRAWHVLFRSRYPGLFTIPKILIRQTADCIIAAIDTNVTYYCIDSVNVAKLKPEYYDKIHFFLCLLNSKLLNFYYREISQEGGRVLAQVKPQRIRILPIAEAMPQQQAAILKLVNGILAITKDDNYLENSTKQVKVREYEKQIDQLVYKLYGLTPEEIKLIENAS